MNILRSMVSIFLLVSMSLSAHVLKGPAIHESGLLVPDSIIPLSQADFNSGTYRIQSPGYYYLTENISFDPDPTAEATRTDKPRTTWFAAISIECDNVIIDLNTKTLDMSENFLNNHGFKVFGLIELNNSPFPHLVFAFTGEDEVKNAHNVVIKNGTLGRNSHHGIHGNNNSNIAIYDLVVKDWEVAGISLNGLKSGEIKNVAISGVEHTVPFTGLLALLLSTRLVLQELVDKGDSNTQGYIDALDIVINDDNQNGKNHPTGTHDGNTYGLFISRIVDVGPIVTHCDSKTANAITIENVSVDNIQTSIIETVGMADLAGGRLKGDLFGVLRWVDAYPNDTFAPNSILKAQVYGVQQNNPDKLPAGFADNILSNSSSEELFLSQVQPLFNSDFAGHTNKGAFGIRLDCGHGVTMKDCRVLGVENVGSPGMLISSLPGRFYSSFEQTRYTGNDTHGISLAACHNCELADCSVIQCSSENGMVNGIAIINESSCNKFTRCESNNHYALLDNQDSVVNPSSVVYGFLINNGSNVNRLIYCTSQLLQSLRYCFGFWVHNVRDAVMEDCLSVGHSVTASASQKEEKVVAGFVTTASDGTIFRRCEARKLLCDSESEFEVRSKSRSIGFFLGRQIFGGSLREKRTLVSKCIATGNDAGAGKAMGILLNYVELATIFENTVSNHVGSAKKGKGFGIYSGSKNDDFLILGNLAHGNDRNYRIKNQDIPLVELFRDNVDNHNNNPWYNTSIK